MCGPGRTWEEGVGKSEGGVERRSGDVEGDTRAGGGVECGESELRGDERCGWVGV